MTKVKTQRIVIALCFLCAVSGRSESLAQIATNRLAVLEGLIASAGAEGIDTRREQMTVRTAEVFLNFADWDENNIDINSSIFALGGAFKNDPDGAAEMLPDFERNDISLMLNTSISNLTRLRAEEKFQEPVPVIDWSKITLDGDQLTHNGRPVFLEYYTWKPDEPELTEFHGDSDGFFLMHSYVTSSNGTINSKIVTELAEKSDGTAGFIFLNNKNTPNWVTNAYGANFRMREDTYTAYDIDHPGARELNSMLLAGTVPYMAGKSFSQLGYMLCNEPHFYTTKKKDTSDPADWDWASGPVSDYTKNKFRTWLRAKHSSIEELNALWETSFESFEDVAIEIPIYTGEQGTPKWYDWMRFNNLRVTDWYTWLKSEIRTNDSNAKVHLKIMPNLWSENKRGHGIDFEALSRLSDIMGNDASTDYNNWWGKTLDWQDRYAFGWRELSMSYDFLKSVSPGKIIFNTESHLLSTGSSRDLYMDPAYARAAFWLAHVQGLNASQIWFWARTADGSPRNGVKVGTGYWGSNNQQPRVVNEVHSTLMDLNTYSDEITAMQRQRKPLRIFYSETSAINKPAHMDDVFELYEALYFDGVPIGFATENIIGLQDNSLWDAILVCKTEYVTTGELAALQTYLDQGGTVITDDVSLKMDEYGRALSSSLNASAGTLLSADSLDDFETQALAVLDVQGGMPPVRVSEENSIGLKGCTWKCVTNSAGNAVLSIVNLGKTEANLTIELTGSSTGTACYDLLSGMPVSSAPTLAPFEVLFLEVSPATDWNEYAAAYGLSGRATTDRDGDGQLDIYEYALCGNPTNPAERGVSPRLVFGSDDKVAFRYMQRTNSDIRYQVDWTTNLINAQWSVELDGLTDLPVADADYTEAGRQIDGAGKSNLFFRLKISQQ